MIGEEDLFAFLEKTADAAFSVTEQGEICSWNSSAENLFGYRACEVLRRTCHEVLNGRGVPGTNACAAHCGVAKNSTGNGCAPDFDLEVTVRSGRRIWVNVSTLIFEGRHGGGRLIVHLARDIQQRKKNEELVRKMVQLSQQLTEPSDGAEPAAAASPLSEQERRILQLFAKGRNSVEIARDLDITSPTLRNHLHRINQKLGTRNRLEAVMHAIQHKLI